MFVLRTGIQWKALPKTFGASSSIHSYFQDWRKAGFFKALWARGVEVYDEQCADAGYAGEKADAIIRGHGYKDCVTCCVSSPPAS